MKELAQNILIYVVIVTVLRGLISNPKYNQYFQFFSGIIMILLMLSPLLSLLQDENKWYDLFEEKVLQMDLKEIEEEMNIAGDKFEEMVIQEYEETVAKQVRVMAEEKGVGTEEATVKIAREDEQWRIEEIQIVTKAAGEEGQEDSFVETVHIENRGGREREDISADAKALRRQICSYFAIGEDKVHIWK